MQWAALYLTDTDLLDFLIRTKENLEISEEIGSNGQPKSGLLFVKENVCPDKFLIDRDDHSIMRTSE